MNNSEGERLYRVKTKDGAHINEKLKEDGSRAAIQFDQENGLQGPVDLVEVDEEEYTKKVFIEVESKERSLREMIIEDAVAPAVAEILTVLMERAIDAGVDALFTKVIPATKAKGGEFIDKVKNSYVEKGNKKNIKKQSTSITKEKNAIKSTVQKETIQQQSVYHSQEEVDQIISNMKFAALYIAAGIRELSNTIILDSAEAEKALEMEAKFKELSSKQVMNTIDFMLEESNRDKLDQATLQLFEAFRNRNFIVNGEVVPIDKYLKVDKSKVVQSSK